MHTLSEDKIKANQVEGDINLTATRKQWQDKFLSEKSKKLLDEDSKAPEITPWSRPNNKPAIPATTNTKILTNFTRLADVV